MIGRKAYIKTTMGLSLRKFIIPNEVGFSLGNNHVIREKELKLPWGTT
jgi:hypothetical protein